MYDNQSKVLNMCVFYKYYDILCIFGYSLTYNINNDVDKPDHDKNHDTNAYVACKLVTLYFLTRFQRWFSFWICPSRVPSPRW